jgi:hypothetical protein
VPDHGGFGSAFDVDSLSAGHGAAANGRGVGSDSLGHLYGNGVVPRVKGQKHGQAAPSGEPVPITGPTTGSGGRHQHRLERLDAAFGRIQ